PAKSHSGTRRPSRSAYFGSLQVAVHDSESSIASQASPAVALTTPSPQTALVQSALHVALSPAVSQSSPAWTTPSPQLGRKRNRPLGVPAAACGTTAGVSWPVANATGDWTASSTN